MQNQSEWPTGAEVTVRSAESNVDLRRLFFSHKLILTLMVGLGLALGYLKFTRTTPEYASSARVLVARNNVHLPVEGAQRMANYQAPLDTHIELMRTPTILAKAFEDGKIAELSSLEGVSNPEAVVAAGLTVSMSEQSDEILELSYQGSNRFDCQTILNAVVAAYVSFVEESQAKLNQKTVSLINEAKDDLLKSLEEKEQKYQEFREQSKLVWNGDQPQNIHHSRLMAIEGQRAKLLLERKLVLAELESIKNAVEKGLSRDAILMMVMNVKPQSYELEEGPLQGPPQFDSLGSLSPRSAEGEPTQESIEESLQLKLLPLLIQQQRMETTHGYDHPDSIALREEIRLTKSIYQDEIRRLSRLRRQEMMAKRARELELQQKPEEDGKPGTRTVEPDLLSTYVDSLNQRLDLMDRNALQLQAEYDNEEAASTELAKEENRHRALQEDIQRTKKLFDVLLEELQEINLVKSGAYLAVELVSPPGPGRQVAPQLIDNLALGGLGGLLVGLALSFLFEVSDRSFRGPEQIMSQLGLPVVGHIPTLSGKRKTLEGSQADPTLVAFHRPKSRLAESYRAIRVPLLFGSKKDGLKLLQVTSPDPGDGKSTVSANLAIVMANSGKRCLLVDSDFRRPKVGKLFGVDNDIGLSGVLQGDTELADALQPSEVENLDLLTTGKRVRNAAELILSPNFESTLQVLRDKYDFIIIDTPPVLAVTDPSAVASKADAVLMVMRITKRVQLHALRAKETLELVGANLLGVVVNGVGDTSGYAHGAGVYSANTSKYQYAKSPYDTIYYGNDPYGRYSDYYVENDDESGNDSGAAPEPVGAGQSE